MQLLKFSILSATMLAPVAALANENAVEAEQPRDIVVSGAKQESASATKTDTPLIEVPQPVTIIEDEELYLISLVNSPARSWARS